MTSKGSSQGLVRTAWNDPKATAATASALACGFSTRPLATRQPATTATRAAPVTLSSPDRSDTSVATAAIRAMTSMERSAGRRTASAPCHL